MTARRVNLSLLPQSTGPYRGIIPVQDISSDDYEDDLGFTFRAVQAGEVTFRTVLEGPDGDDASKTLPAGGTLDGPGGIPVAVIAVRQNATVTQIEVGMP